MADLRDKFKDSALDSATLAHLAHELRESDGFEADLCAAIGDVLADHVEDEHGIQLDTTAEIEFEDQLVTNGLGGLFMLRGGLVTNADADLEEGDVIRMKSGIDPDETVYHVVRESRPDATRTMAWRVDPEEDRVRGTDLTPGHVRYDGRFEVSRELRGEDGWTVARSLLDDLTGREEDSS